MYYYLGSAFRSFTAENTGEHIEGVSVFFGKDGDKINGVQPIKAQFLTNKRFNELNISALKPMSKVDLFFNEYGKVAMVSPR